MRLTDFLDQYEWDTANKISQFIWKDSNLNFHIEGYPFWLSREIAKNKTGKLVIELVDVVESNINVNWDPEELENITVDSDHPVLWHYRPYSSLFGNSPLNDSSEFLFQFLRICSDLNLLRDPIQYLNAEFGLQKWKEIVNGNSYLLVSAPKQIVESCKLVLDTSDVNYSLVEGPERKGTGANLVVWIDGSWIICKEATVVYKVE